MSKIEFIKNDSDFLISEDLLTSANSTVTESAKKFERKNKGPFTTLLLVGTLLLPQNEDASANSIPFVEQIENIENNLNSYNKTIDNPISEYLEQINDITQTKKYSKIEIIRKILSFKSLNNNWDGCGAYPLEVESAANAIDLIDLVGEDLFCSLNEFYPNPNGTISFEWVNNSNEILSIEIGNKLMSYYLDLSSKETMFHNNKIINAEEAEKIHNYIKLL